MYVWGVGSSPFIATRCLHQVADDDRMQASTLPMTAVRDNMYVDDPLKSVDTIPDGLTLQREMKHLFADSCFLITKWSSNKKIILDGITDDDHAPAECQLGAHSLKHAFQWAMDLEWAPLAIR